MRPQKDFIIGRLQQVSQDDGLIPKAFYYITTESTLGMMNILKFGVESFANGLALD